MTKAIITGGPGTGKTTLLDGLKCNVSHIYFIEEPATLVINSEREKEIALEGYIGKFPWNNYAEFGPLVIEQSLKLESQIPANKEISIQDRSLIDTVAYARINKCDNLLSRLYELIPQAGYDRVFICEPLESYEQTANRAETREEALNTHEKICQAYKEAHLNVNYLPPVDVEARISLVKNLLKI
jgi:predicted ATPase